MEKAIYTPQIEEKQKQIASIEKNISELEAENRQIYDSLKDFTKDYFYTERMLKLMKSNNTELKKLQRLMFECQSELRYITRQK